jgi:hypothetical protein
MAEFEVPDGAKAKRFGALGIRCAGTIDDIATACDHPLIHRRATSIIRVR